MPPPTWKEAREIPKKCKTDSPVSKTNSRTTSVVLAAKKAIFFLSRPLDSSEKLINIGTEPKGSIIAIRPMKNLIYSGQNSMGEYLYLFREEVGYCAVLPAPYRKCQRY
jgi:hypothetical protein